jgi:hypothetical protein
MYAKENNLFSTFCAGECARKMKNKFYRRERERKVLFL